MGQRSDADGHSVREVDVREKPGFNGVASKDAWHKERYMSKAIKDDLPSSGPPVLTDAILHRVHELNYDYLRLLRSEQADVRSAAQLQHFPSKCIELLVRCDERALQKVARSPYTLYSLGFEDLKFWQAACDPRVELSSRYCAGSSSWLQGPFYEVALLFAWHIANSSRLAARVLLAMPDALVELFARTAVSQVRRIAIDYPGLLMPRWPTNPGFWPESLRFAIENDRTRLNNVRLLGTQLIAAQLQAAEGLDARVLNAHRLQYAARVRGGKLRMKLSE